jgi:signal transduction histidine kinase
LDSRWVPIATQKKLTISAPSADTPLRESQEPMNRRILVVDDEPGILDAYRIILAPVAAPPVRIASSRRSNAALATAPEAAPEVFEVTYAATGEAALIEIEKAVAAGTPFAGGFFDVKLGSGIDGIETIRRAKDLDPRLLCCMVTAYQDRNLDEIGKIFGEEFSDRWDFLTKPFAHNEIQQKARNLVSNWDRRKREKEYLEQIQAQQDQLVRSERLAAIGALARGIGHEFGNILHRLIGIAEIALQKKEPQEMESSLQLIATAAERAGVIVRNLQSLVKMQSKREDINLYEPLKECLSLIDHELKKASVKVVENWDGGLPRILGNKVEIGQVFLNLMINAIHAMEPKGGTLTITSSLDQGKVTVRISDSGCGIAPENLPQIFEPLFTTKGDKGTGIGLSVTRKIVVNHSGEIGVSSEVGKGTTFTLRFPAVP